MSHLLVASLALQSLNPYYTGSYSMRLFRDMRMVRISGVLILIILEVTL